MKSIFKTTIVILSICLMISCSGEEQLLSVKKVDSGNDKLIKKLDSENTEIFLSDGTQSIFEKKPWYHYDFDSHKIWPLFDVYAVQTPDEKLYKMQIISYYDVNLPTGGGKYLLRIKPRRGETKEILINAQACGNSYTNPDYDICVKDPNKNAYTYLTLDGLLIEKMSDEKAKRKRNWNIAFKRTEVILNNGENIDEATLVGLLYKDTRAVDLKILQEKVRNNFDKSSFIKSHFSDVLVLQSPSYISRVIAQEDWIINNEKSLSANKDSSWYVLSHNLRNVYIFKVSHVELSDSGLTQLNFELSQRESPSSSKIFPIKFNNSVNKIDLCIRYNDETIFDCSAENKKWDIRFKSRPSDNKLKWFISTNSGARILR